MQQQFWNPSGIIQIRQLPGASGGVLLDCIGEGYFAAKDIETWKPYTLVSEWLCADIAGRLGLPIPWVRSIVYNGRVLFGMEWRSGAIGYEPGIEQRLTNPETIAGMLAFDVLICNQDRHGQNMLFQRPSENADRYQLILIDHSHALIGDMQSYASLENLLRNTYNPDPLPFLMSPPEGLLRQIKSWSDFDTWLERIEAITESELDDCVARMPSEWRPPAAETAQLIQLLVSRKDMVRTLLRNAVGQFPNLMT